jgi:WD40-like Beta Propeller Repeat
MTRGAHLGGAARSPWVGLWVALWLSVGLGGCGNVTVDPPVGNTRGSGGSPDAAAVAPACDPSKPFGTPSAAEVFNSAGSDDGLSLSADGLTAYVSRSSDASLQNFDLFQLTKASTDQSFGPATALGGGINTADQERAPQISRDGLKLYYFSNHVAASAGDLLLATRASTTALFGAGAVLGALDTAANESSPFLASADRVLYFASDRAGGPGATDIYRVPLVGATGSPGTPSLVSEINSAAAENRPVLSDDGLTLYFDRSGTSADDIWVATRSTPTGVFSGIHGVTELNGPGIDFPLWLSADGCTLYFSSDRESGKGGHTGWDIFQATRPR